MKLNAWLLTRTALSSGLVVGASIGTATAADIPIMPVTVAPPTEPVPLSLPAVSGINGKIDFAWGGISPPFFFGPLTPEYRIQGAVSVPLGYSVGLQVDAAYASIFGLPFLHGAAHLFWRDPAMGLVGAYGSFSTWAGVGRWRAGAQGEVYFGRLSLEGIIGVEFGTLPTSWFGMADIAVYPADNLRISVGVRHSLFGNSLAGAIEYQFASNGGVGWAAYVEGEIGTAGYHRILAGVRLYFGEDKTLITRHREDDPRIWADERICVAYVTDGLVALDTICAVDAFVDP